VDRVIHNRGKVSESVRRRVLQVMKELDYAPNVNARVLARKEPLKLGILLPSYRKGEYWELPWLGIDSAMKKYSQLGYRIVPKQRSYRSPENFLSAGLKMISDRVDGVILNPSTFKESVRLVRAYFQHNIPFILIDSDIPALPSMTFIGKDPVQSGLTVAKLIHQITKHIPGRKSIWIINLARTVNQMYALLARESGFMSYFSGKELMLDYAFSTYDMEDRGTRKEIEAKLGDMIGRERPDAIYVTGSRVHKIASALKKLNAVPKPLLIGHDLIRANMERIRDESIDFLIEEEAERQGYLAVESMIRSVIHKEEIGKKQWMNLMIYTRENLPSDPVDQGR
jgi:LacI family transcriptional regulator